MVHRRSPGFLVLVFAWAIAACGGPPANASTRPVPTSYEEYALAACAAWDRLFVAVGNPDTASGSDLSRSLDAAVAERDGTAAERVARDITIQLQAGREQVAIAAGWPPRAEMMRQLDRVFGAFEAMVAAKAALAKGAPGALDPQAAFEQAGGVDAWFAMLEAARTADPGPAASDVQQCPTVPVTP